MVNDRRFILDLDRIMFRRCKISFICLTDSKLEKCGSQTGHDDEDLFKERLKNMGKSKRIG